jgi:Protein of unknown function (DUF1759)
MPENNYDQLRAHDGKMAFLMSDQSDEEQDAEFNAVAECECKFKMIKAQVEKYLQQAKGKHSSQTSSSSSREGDSTTSTGNGQRRTYKLPKIEIKKFSGVLKDWLGFWAQFDKIHRDADLHESDKFQYLIQSMVPGTRAEKLVTSYTQKAENYPLVVAALNDRFGDKVILTEVYVRQLLKLVIRNANTGQSEQITLSTIYDEIESHLRALETLGVTQDQSAAFLYPLVESSLPVETIQAWQRSSMSGYDGSLTDNKAVDERLKSLIKFIRSEVKGAERIAYVTEGFSESVKIKPTSHKERRNTEFQRTSPPTAAGLFACNAGQVTKSVLCIFCDEKHESEKCGNAPSMPYSIKKRKVIDKKACMCCLKVGHMACYVKCIICQKTCHANVP